MTDFQITADATKVSPASFIRSLGLSGTPKSFEGYPQTSPDKDGNAFVFIPGRGWLKEKVA